MKVITQTPLDTIRAEEQTRAQLRETISRLEEDNATLTYELMMKDAKISVLEAGQAELIYELMNKGVL
ncbi:HTH-type transcriptional activator AmpR [Sporosarcina newyorkensis 2681]|uniref:HTH-type transcriptional activator AmpR n=1 Tax=Sporosarcina newyorkensis 2681 TaxID=1027292 RepID=F9DX08_9BACL|nr:hypothetical protein [Sporosarcina newyorkensis]EGQ21302.1 HTH-type transcriptional activator AmpR [Sporosarcina newyorkensis 2681]